MENDFYGNMKRRRKDMGRSKEDENWIVLRHCTVKERKCLSFSKCRLAIVCSERLAVLLAKF